MRYVLTLAAILSLFASQAFAKASIVPAFSKFSSAGMSVDAGKQGTNTMQVIGATFSKPGGKPTMTIPTAASELTAAAEATPADGATFGFLDSVFKKLTWANIKAIIRGGVAYDTDYANLNAAVTAIGSTPRTLKITTDQTLTGNLAVPATLELIPLNGAVINRGAYTISIASSTARWSLAQVFNGTGAVTGLVQAWPEWFETNTTPGTTDMTEAIKSALVASKSVKLLGTAYKVTDVLEIYSGTSLCGATPVFGAYIPITPVEGETTFVFAPTSEKDLFHVKRTAAEISGGAGNTKYAVEIANIRVVGNSTGGVTYSRYGVYNDTTALSYFHNLSFQRFQVGIYNSFTLTNDFTNVALYNMTVACVKYDTATSTTDVWTNCKFDSSPWGVVIEKALSIKFVNPLFQTLSVGGMNLHKAASGIQVIAGYGEDVPGSDAGSAMFRVGYDGSGSVEDVNQLSVIGGRYGGINAVGSYYGSFLDVDYNYSVRVTDVDVSRFLNLVKATANTRDKGINWNNNSFTACTNSFVDTTGKITGLYYVADLSTGNFLRLFADRAYLDGPLELLGAGVGIVMKNAAGTVTKTIRLNDAGTGLVFE